MSTSKGAQGICAKCLLWICYDRHVSRCLCLWWMELIDEKSVFSEESCRMTLFVYFVHSYKVLSRQSFTPQAARLSIFITHKWLIILDPHPPRDNAEL